MRIQRLAAIALAILTQVTAFAIPARRGSATLTQPDGSTFTVTLRGDEYQHLMLTNDGHAVVKDADGWYSYAEFDAAGRRSSSGIHIGKGYPASSTIPYAAIAAHAQAKRSYVQDKGDNLMIRLNKQHFGEEMLTKAGSSSVDKHGIVILVQFTDKKFRYTKEDFVNLLTQTGYSYNGATGCAKEYFDDQFNGSYNFLFDVSDIVTLSQNCAYYGANDSNGDDKRPEEMIMEACKLVDSQIDFSLYDDDNDGEVDNVFVFFAGGDEAEYAGDDCIWSHSWYVKDGAGKNLTLDGKVINRYACTSECTTTDFKTYTLMAPIGTFCHEFSHTLGLPDLYDTDYTTNGQTDGLWGSTALMDYGNANNNGNTPPYFNVLERELLGLATPVSLPSGNITMTPMHEGGATYKLTTDVDGEYYLLEFRYPEGWDKYIGGTGLLVYHIDRSTKNKISGQTAYSLWDDANMVNAYKTHACANILEANPSADGKYNSRYSSSSSLDISDIFFPYRTYNSISPSGSRTFSYWSGKKSDVSVTSITLSGKTLTMSVSGAGEAEVPPTVTSVSVDRFQTSAILSFTSSNAASSATAKVAYAKSGSTSYTTVQATASSAGNFAVRLDGLDPKTSYEARVYFSVGGVDGEATTSKFMTVALPDNSLPFIYLKNVDRNEDGSFPIGVKLPLVVGGVAEYDGVTWYYNSREIKAGSDCYYTPSSSNELKADVVYNDGTHDIIVKYINISK